MEMQRVFYSKIGAHVTKGHNVGVIITYCRQYIRNDDYLLDNLLQYGVA